MQKLILAAASLALLSGCNTVHGAQKDAEVAGDKVSEAAGAVKEKVSGDKPKPKCNPVSSDDELAGAPETTGLPPC